jgi:hypothetical protein
MFFFQNHSASKQMSDIDSILKKEQHSFSQDKEIERIMALNGITENPLEILDLPVSCWAKLEVDLKGIIGQ